MDEVLKQNAISYFNATWDLIDKTDRTHAEDIEMIHKAHTSCQLWKDCGGAPVNLARGEWQISRVYAILNMGEMALLHGQYSLAICDTNSIGDFDLAFGYEAVARAYSIIGDNERCEQYKSKAVEAAGKIAEADDKKYCLSEMQGINNVKR